MAQEKNAQMPRSPLTLSGPFIQYTIHPSCLAARQTLDLVGLEVWSVHAEEENHGNTMVEKNKIKHVCGSSEGWMKVGNKKHHKKSGTLWPKLLYLKTNSCNS